MKLPQFWKPQPPSMHSSCALNSGYAGVDPRRKKIQGGASAIIGKLENTCVRYPAGGRNPNFGREHSSWMVAVVRVYRTNIPSRTQAFLSPTTVMGETIQSAIRLPSELWLDIFMKNTERDDRLHQRLRTARHCSQVCQLWRKILLSSASVWGRLVDLDYLQQGTDEWKDLILSRAGSALLWITGRISLSTWRFVVALLDEKWENVQILDVWESRVAFLYPEGTGAFFGRPAPNLESLSIRLYNRWPFPKTFTLFSDVAPRLTEIEASFFLNINSTFTWLSQIHRITFHTSYANSNILSLLKWMPQLKCLRIYRAYSNTVLGINQGVDRDDPASVCLPQLQSLQLFGPQSDLIPFLELIKPSPMCSITVSSTISSAPGNVQDSNDGVQAPLSRFYRALFPWILAYIKGRAPRDMSLQADVFEHFTMHDACKMFNLEKEHLKIEIALDNHCHAAIAELGTWSESFSSVKQLIVCIEDNHDALVPIYKAFTSVTELTLEAMHVAVGLAALHADAEEEASILFPQLRSLRVMLVSKALSNNDIPKIVLDIVNFVKNRAGVGFPLSCLDFLVVDPRITILDADKELLQKLPGLTVKIKSSSWD
ncbi:hypothetical protein CPC08DRAFT_753835 [Agrocybe pediades]|nr:hypothetical protein CPC08DRAFT_753835 [Agrocybe pediades]